MAMGIRKEVMMRPMKVIKIATLVLAGTLFATAGTTLSQIPQGRFKLLNSGITVTLNPTGIAPLSALATFQSTIACSVQVRVLGDIEVSKIFEDNGTSHEIPILGLYPNRLNAVFLTLFTHHGTPEVYTLTVRTNPLPDFFPTIEINAATPDRMEPGMNLSAMTVSLGSKSSGYPIIFDRNGDIRWYLDLSAYGGLMAPFERISDGNYIGGSGASVFEYDPLGRLVDQITLPGYNFHHDIRELPNGHLVCAVDKAGTQIITYKGTISSQEDYIIEIDRTTKQIVNSWDMREILDVSRKDTLINSGDWFHNNGLWYSASDNCLIISGRVQGVVKVTWDNKVKWILSPHQSWGNAGWDGSGPPTAPYLLTAVDPNGNPYPDAVQEGDSGADDFDWGWGQHNPHLLANGNLFFFDNGDFRYYLTDFPKYSRAAEFVVDENAMTVRQVWQYGKERGPETWSRIISAVDSLPQTGNRSFCPGIVQTAKGTYAKVIEVTYPDNAVVFEATIHFKNLLAPPNTAIADIVYRSHRISIYP
jgi:arylsulfate sulfotransferase